MYSYKYPHPAVTTDCVIFGFDGTKLQVLLVERGLEPYKGRWAFPGGFLKMDESAVQGARRELFEETGLKAEYMEQFHTFSDPCRDPRERVITIAYYALCKISEVKGGDDAAKARWFTFDEMPQLAFDHDHILRCDTSVLRERIHFHPIGFDLLPGKFTMKELQLLYEAIYSARSSIVPTLLRKCCTSNCSQSSTKRYGPRPSARPVCTVLTRTATRNINGRVSDLNSEG